MNYRCFLNTYGIDLQAETHIRLLLRTDSMDKNVHWEVKIELCSNTVLYFAISTLRNYLLVIKTKHLINFILAFKSLTLIGYPQFTKYLGLCLKLVITRLQPPLLHLQPLHSHSQLEYQSFLKMLKILYILWHQIVCQD